MSTEQAIPEHVDKERVYDIEWVRNNMYLFDPLARAGDAALGPGAIFVNITEFTERRYDDEGHPFFYGSVENTEWLEPGEYWIIEGSQPEEIRRMMREHNPSTEFVVVIDKFESRSAYQLPLWREEERDMEIRGSYVTAEADEIRARLASPGQWGRDFRLASRYEPIWPAKE